METRRTALAAAFIRRSMWPMASFDIFGALSVAKIEADRHQNTLRALGKRRRFSASTAAVSVNAAMMTFLEPCAAMALPPSREYLTR